MGTLSLLASVLFPVVMSLGNRPMGYDRQDYEGEGLHLPGSPPPAPCIIARRGNPKENTGLVGPDRFNDQEKYADWRGGFRTDQRHSYYGWVENGYGHPWMIQDRRKEAED